MAAALLRQPWTLYLRALESQPLATKALTSSLLGGLGDSVAQSLERRWGVIDERAPWRTLRVASFNLMFVGPIFHFWYRWLDGVTANVDRRLAAMQSRSVLVRVMQWRSLGTAFGKTLVTHAVVSTGILTWYFVYVTALEPGSTVADIGRRLQRDFMAPFKAGWAVWIPTQMVNFLFVPPRQRVLALSVVSFHWNVYLSYVKHKPLEADDERDKDEQSNGVDGKPVRATEH